MLGKQNTQPKEFYPLAERGRRPLAFFVFELENNTPTVFFKFLLRSVREYPLTLLERAP